ncbi:hypothetical protein [Alkalinema sp. FACHB-956]|uniref:hypothetical protein n=1 Tax=Alkalinema sp. FACHB-956 TaxID=2692768 RepID=UPI0016846031|nr:hypothetical protein [Alkalinema sp. FACHB-956]MBD2329288.1 hypothetical protein [Alkalinema sp. FACHB-956]
MSQEIVQWLNEIKDLKQQIADLQQTLAEVTASADKWRQLYETEAQQRRQDVTAMQARITHLQTEIAQFQAGAAIGLPSGNLPGSETLAPLSPDQSDGFVSMEDLKIKLAKVWSEREQLTQALKEEQAAHDRTRKDMTLALADAMDTLRKMRGAD